MPDCSRIDALVTPFVDGELPQSEQQAIAGHIAACPPCRAKVAAERSVRALIKQRRADLGACASPGLKKRCALLAGCSPEASAARSAPGAVVRPFVTRWRERLAPFAAAAALLVIVVGLVYQATGRSNRLLAAELTADHEKCFRLNKLLGTHDTAQGVEAAMASGFGWRMQMPDVSTHPDISVVGSRPCLYGEGTAAHIMFMQDGQPVSLFMLKRGARSEDVVEVFGHQCRIWSEGDRTFVLVARASTVPLEQMAAFVRTTIK
jgi:anti-sigma factor RsiW